MFKNQKTAAIIVAAGRGERMRGVDKVLAPLAGKPVLAWSAEVFQQSPLVDLIVIVLSQSNLEQGRKMVADMGWSKVSDVCAGGEERQQSVANGLELLEEYQWVIIHDAARPLITEALIKDGLEAAAETGTAVAGLPVTDTIKLADDDGFVIGTPPRKSLWAVQTPQVFQFDIIKNAHHLAGGMATDDASLVERLNHHVKLYHGKPDNIKITVPADLAIAETLLKRRA
ncbi:2-C-methyl-D-erythritol 4-phosphate cytidylyltransferase [Chloroflexota bacterium]